MYRINLALPLYRFDLIPRPSRDKQTINLGSDEIGGGEGKMSGRLMEKLSKQEVEDEARRRGKRETKKREER